MSEFKQISMLRHGDIVQAIAAGRDIQIASPRFPGDGHITLTEEEGGAPALHAWLTQVLGLPDLAQMQRRVEEMEGDFRSLRGFISRRSADGLTPKECVSAVGHIDAALGAKP